MCLPITLDLEQEYTLMDCPYCDGSGEEVDHARINCRSIDIPYKDCDNCSGTGKIEVDFNIYREIRVVH